MARPNCLSNVPGILAAELTIDGLALCHFQLDQTGRYWEIAYPRQRKHSLAISIEEVGSGRPAMPHHVDETLESFTIKLDTGTDDIYQNFDHGGCHTGTFNRKGTGNDPNDVRWMIDVAGREPDHGTATLRRKGDRQVGVTVALLRHSLLFTRRPSDHPVRLIPKCSGDPAANGVELGPTNREMGALMIAPAAGTIKFEGITGISDLPFDANTSYKIEIINDDQFPSEKWPGHVKGDFHLLYDIVNVTGVQKELWAVPDTHGRVAPDGDCNPNGFGTSSLQELIA
jgi:hypothetical protein